MSNPGWRYLYSEYFSKLCCATEKKTTPCFEFFAPFGFPWIYRFSREKRLTWTIFRTKKKKNETHSRNNTNRVRSDLITINYIRNGCWWFLFPPRVVCVRELKYCFSAVGKKKNDNTTVFFFFFYRTAPNVRGIRLWKFGFSAVTSPPPSIPRRIISVLVERELWYIATFSGRSGC